jgi:hypothetical protein
MKVTRLDYLLQPDEEDGGGGGGDDDDDSDSPAVEVKHPRGPTTTPSSTCTSTATEMRSSLGSGNLVTGPALSAGTPAARFGTPRLRTTRRGNGRRSKPPAISGAMEAFQLLDYCSYLVSQNARTRTNNHKR